MSYLFRKELDQYKQFILNVVYTIIIYIQFCNKINILLRINKNKETNIKYYRVQSLGLDYPRNQ